MKRTGLAALMETVTARTLRELVTLKGKMEELETKRKAVERSLSDVDGQLTALEREAEKLLGGSGGVRGGPRGTGRRIAQPPLAGIVAEVLREKGMPLKVTEICQAVLEEKHYRTQAKDFKSQVRILLYKNEKGLFTKTGRGLFSAVGTPPKAVR